jgi:hypothetical protein
MGERISELTAEVGNFIKHYTENKPTEITAHNLRDIVPDQKIGPVQFAFKNRVLSVRHSPAVISDVDKKSALAARKSLLQNGEWILNNLRSSNQDPRLIETLEEHQGRLRKNSDIIQLGISSLSCQMTFDRFEQEMPEAVATRMQAYTIGNGMYLGQFPDWIRFSENAAIAEYSERDVQLIYSAGVDLIGELIGVQEVVSPEVPRTLTWILNTIRDPRLAVRRAVFAAIRSLENFVSKIFIELGKILEGGASGIRKGVELATKGVVTIGLLAAAAHVATAVSPSAAKILQTTWLQKAAKIVLEAISSPEK